MTRIVIVGICGQMGHALKNAVADSKEFTIAAGVDRLADAAFACPIYGTLDEVTEDFDVIIDFSVPTVLEDELRYVREHHKPAVICTTGLTDEHYALLRETAETVPVFNSGNMSLGVNLQLQLLRTASAALGADFDVEIVERHHRRKVDAPSGTALMLANAVNSQRENALEYKYGRDEKNRRRPDNELGFHSVRGGTIVGEHEVSFIGQDEILEITHKAFSKRVFAEGALRAAAYLTTKQNGLYDMEMMFAEQNAAEPAAEPKDVTEQPAALLTVSTPAEESALLAYAGELLAKASVTAAATAYLPLTERAGFTMALQPSDLGSALEALQELQAAHETLDVQVQGGAVLLRTAVVTDAGTVLAQLLKVDVVPQLCVTDADKISLCVKNSEKPRAVEVLKFSL